MTEDDPLWTDEEVAEFLGNSTDTLRAWRHKGGGPVFTKAGRKAKYFRSDVIAWLRENRYSRTDQKVTARAGTASR